VQREEHSAVNKAVVLVVEDEFLVRLCATDALHDAGYDVLDAGNAETAIEILEKRNDVGVVFTDVNMPGQIMGSSLQNW
jgi:CheY-like chemotaxis protein